MLNSTVPIISVVMPVYNGEEYLKDAIDSVLSQSFKNFEFIIVNDGSVDKTEEIILSYKDERIIYLKNIVNLKIVLTLNKGIANAKGKYIARMDADDVSYPDRFEKQLNFMENNPQVGVCGTWVNTFGKNRVDHIYQYPVSSEDIKITLMFCSPFAHPSILMRKCLFDSYIYDEAFKKAEDYHLWCKIKNATCFGNIPEVLLDYRIHEDQTSSIFSKAQLMLANKLRFQAVNDFGIEPSDKEMALHEAISENYIVSLEDAKKWLEKLYDKNIEVNYFERPCFEIFLHDKWWEIVNRNTKYGLSTFFFYLKGRKLKFNKKINVVKLFVKCLMKMEVKLSANNS